MEAYIINTSMGFVNENKDEFIEIGEIKGNEENKKMDYSFIRKIKNLLKITSITNKIGIEDMV
jgi:hypothetical protein